MQSMRLEGIHHITAITGDARANLDFYARVLGLRFVKKTVNFDSPEAYHLYYGDELGQPGSIMTFFEFPGVPPGRAGAGMIHRIAWRVGDAAALDYWAGRLGAEGVDSELTEGALQFADPEGLELELVVAGGEDPSLTAAAEDIPEEHRLLGFHGVRAYSHTADSSDALLGEALGFERRAGEWTAKGEKRHASYAYDKPPAAPGLQGAGTVHHIAWASRDADHESWRVRVGEAGAQVTPIIDRQYFRSIYFREPSGVLFEIATLGPGFAVDEPPDRLGESLRLPPQHEPLREHLERALTPLENPRSSAAPR
jgi:glyoxalase family protein